MTELTVHNIEDEIAAKLRKLAERRGVSAEEEALRILREAVSNVSLHKTERTFVQHLMKMPNAGDDSDFEGSVDSMNPAELSR
jgi:plasmid stability protein